MKETSKSARLILATNIKVQRKKQNLSQEELAFISGLHRTYISSVERCQRNISIDAIEKIAIALNIPINRLLEN